jgi:hypothetical protein
VSETVSPRPISASRPEPEPEALRRSYLELLKLALCNLTGTDTREVTSDRHKRVFSRELVGEEQLGWRVEGRDWPLDGLTMVGLHRLDDLQACIEAVTRDAVPGDLIEAGAWRGGASIFIRCALNSLGGADRTLWVADSFEGFPVPDAADSAADRELESHMSEIAFPAPPLETVRTYFARFGAERGVEFVRGFFEDTMPGLGGRAWSLIRLDADTYKATKLALETLYPGLAAGGYVILDDYFHPFLREACRRAVDDFRAECGITEPIEQIDFTGARWRRESAPDAGAVAGAGDRPELVTAPARPQRPAPRIPTDYELGLEDERAALRARLDEMHAELDRLRSSPLAAVRARRGRG